MSSPCQTCGTNHDVAECCHCGEEICEDCHHVTIDFSWVCPGCKEPYEEEYRSEHHQMYTLLAIVLEEDLPPTIKQAIREVLRMPT